MHESDRPRGPEPAFIAATYPQRPVWHLVGPAEANPRGWIPTDWRLRLDPENVGLSEGWGENGLPPDTMPAEVPGVWNTTAPGYTGVAWYEALCEPRLPIERTIRLVIGAANYLTDAWLNGVYLGRHEGGYDAFAFRCTDLLRRGENRVTLRIVDPPLDREIDGLRLRESPTSKESWYGGAGGPWGGVWFEESLSMWVDDVRVYGDLPRERAVLSIRLGSSLPDSTMVSLYARVGDGGVATTVAVPSDGCSIVLEVAVPSSRPWSPESPSLYWWQVGVEMGWPDDAEPADERRQDLVFGRFGFRTCEFRDGVFYLNDEPRFLKGVLVQPTYPRDLLAPPLPVRTGPELPLSLSDRDVRAAKAASVNLLRCHLRPPPHRFLESCDRQGIMAYVEPPLAWIEPSGRLLEHGKRELEAMVRACGNHPSVVMWGIFNENQRATDAVGGELLAELARLDPTRLIVENSGGAAVGEVGMWAWGGQTRCWSPGWDAPGPLNDVHVYLANPLRKDARQLMLTLGDGPTLDVTPGRAKEERIESRLAVEPVLVSEYGCGALPDFDAALAAFGEEQHLADAILLHDLRDDLARGLAERGLDHEIGGVPELVRKTQALQAEGILVQTAAFRRNPNVSGLILTQLADAGWEQMAGLVGLWRHPRPALAAFTRAMQPRLLHVEPDEPCTTGTVRVRAWLIQEPGLPPLADAAVVTVTVENALTPQPPLPTRGRGGDGGPISPSSTSILTRSVPVRLPLSRARERGSGGEGVSLVRPLATMTLPFPSEPGRYQVHARLTIGEWVDEASCIILRLPDRKPETGAGLALLGRQLRRGLPDALTDLPSTWTGPILAHLPSRPALSKLKLAVERARAGAHLCLVGLEPAQAARLEPVLGLPLTMHGGRGNFMGMHHYLREHPLFDGLGAPCLTDGVFAEVLPAWAVEELPGAEGLAGCFTVPDGGRGFLWRASVQTIAFGRGRLTLYQLGIGTQASGALGRHLLDGLVRWLRVYLTPQPPLRRGEGETVRLV